MQVEFHDNNARECIKDEKQVFWTNVKCSMEFPEIGIIIGTGKKWYKPFIYINLWYVRISIGWFY